MVLVTCSPATAQDQKASSPSSNSLKVDEKAISETGNGGSIEELLNQLPAEDLEAGKAAQKEFLKIKAKLVETLGEMRATHIRFQNDVDRTPTAIDQYRNLRNISRDLMNSLFESGLEVTRHMPDQEILTYLVTALEHRTKFDYYDASSMEAGARLIDGGIAQNLSFLYLATMRSAIVQGDFELARRLIKVFDIEKLDEVDQKLVYLVDELETQYKADQELQKQDDEKGNNPEVRMITTRGEVTIQLFINQAPSTVANFIELVERNYYDGLDFHQVIEHLLALTGDDSGTGQGNSGKFLLDEHERPDVRRGLAGSLVMAKQPLDNGNFVSNSASAQFAILLLPVTSVSKNQTVFGRVTKGLDVIGELRRVDPAKKKKKNEIVLPPDRILSIEVLKRPETLPEIQYADPNQVGVSHAGHNHGPATPAAN